MSEAPEVAERLPQTPAEQDSAIPKGWKPTVAEPVPVVRCTVIKKNGERCNQWSMRGLTKCYAHGKRELNFPSVVAHRDAVIEAARMKLLDASDDAADTLKELLQPGTAEGIRLKAATEILDRNGIRGGFEVDVEVGVKSDPAQVIRERLARLAKAAEASADGDDGDTVLDAEVVDDDQLTLFDD